MKTSRSEAEQDRLDAAAQFATGHTLEARQDSSGAMRCYARAARLDPEGQAPLRELIPLTYGANRRAMAMRYAVRLAQLDKADVTLLRRIGEIDIEAGDGKSAVPLLEKALKAQEREPKPTAALSELRMELGQAYFLAERYRDAAAVLDKVVAAIERPQDFGLSADEGRKLAGENGLNLEVIATTYLEVDRSQDAERVFKKLAALSPDKGIEALNKARVAAKQKRSQQALAELQTYFDSQPKDLSVAALEILPGVLKDGEHEQELPSRLEKLRSKWPDSIVLLYFSAEQLMKTGKMHLARPLYEAAVARQPSGDGFRALAEIYRKSGDIPALLDILGLTHEKTGSLDMLGEQLKTIQSDGDLPRRLIDYARDKLSEPNEANALPLQGAAALALSRKEFDVADTLYNRAVGSTQTARAKAEILLTWGLELLNADRFDAAVAVFRRAVEPGKAAADKPAVEYYLAGALEMAGQTDEALTTVDKMLAERKPKEARYIARRAWILYHAKRNLDAYQAYKDLIERFDDDFESEDNRDTLRDAREALSSLCVVLHRLPEAEEWLQQVLDEFPDDVGAHNDLGYLWADQNRHLRRALAMIQYAVAAEPKNLAYRDSLGWALFRMGRDAEAIAELEKAAGEDDPDGTILEHLGDVQQHAGQHDKAIASWRRAEAKFAKDGEAERRAGVAAKLK